VRALLARLVVHRDAELRAITAVTAKGCRAPARSAATSTCSRRPRHAAAEWRRAAFPGGDRADRSRQHAAKRAFAAMRDRVAAGELDIRRHADLAKGHDFRG
jgi:hypothetical protein